MDKDSAIQKEVKRAFTHFHDPHLLSKHSLASWLPPKFACYKERGVALQQWLQEALEQLKPVRREPDSSKVWRPYNIFFYKYVEGLEFRDILRKMGISESEFYRQQQQGLEAISHFLTETWRAVPPPPVGIEPIPEVDHFVGRQQELAEYRRLLEEQHFALLSGMAGLGKTSLGAELARALEGRFRVIWFSFCPGRNTHLHAVLEGLALSLAALGQDEYWRFLQADRMAPHSADVHIRYLANILTKGNYLLCFDNAELAAEDSIISSLIEDLLRSACTTDLRVLVIGRNLPLSAQKHPVQFLEGLQREDGQLFLEKMGITLPGALFDRLYTRCEGVPIFMRLFAAWVQNEGLLDAGGNADYRQIEIFIDHLSQQLDVRQYLLCEVYDTLSKVEQRFLEVLAAFRLPIHELDEGALRVFAAEGIEDVTRSLVDLVRRRLISRDKSGRLSLHPLIKEHCYHLLNMRPSNLLPCHRHIAAYYEACQDPLEAAYHSLKGEEYIHAARILIDHQLLLINSGKGNAALELLESIIPFLAGQADDRLHFEVAETQERLYELRGECDKQSLVLARMAGLAVALHDDHRVAAVHNRWAVFHQMKGNYLAATEAAQKGLEAARRCGDRPAEVESLNFLGVALHRRGEYPAARSLYEEALARARSGEECQKEALVLNCLGGLAWETGDCQAAHDYFQQALSIWSALDDQKNKSLCLNNLTAVSFEFGDYSTALKYVREALSIAQSLGDKVREAIALANVGNFYLDIGDDLQAQAYLEQARQICLVTTGKTRVLAIVLNNLAYLSCNRGEYALARQHSSQALEIGRAIGNPHITAYGLLYFGMALEGLADLEAARQAYGEAQNLCHQSGQEPQEMDCRAGLARIALAQGKRAEASSEAEEILAYLSRHGSTGVHDPILVYHTCGSVLSGCGQPLRAREAFRAGKALLEQQAAKIIDPDLRRCFLENIALHRAMQEIVTD